MRCFFGAKNALMVLTSLLNAVACVPQKAEWKDPSKHHIQFVTVQPKVRLEVRNVSAFSFRDMLSID